MGADVLLEYFLFSSSSRDGDAPAHAVAGVGGLLERLAVASDDNEARGHPVGSSGARQGGC